MVQPQMEKHQQLMVPSSFQSGLANLPIFVPKNKIIQQWKMDQQTLAKRGIKSQMKTNFFYTN
jgi:hypothetical protein